MLRTLLLVACLLRLAPAPGMAASHCAPMVAGGEHHHAAAAPEAPAPEHHHQGTGGECSHCPPSHCAQVPSCATAGLAGTAAEGDRFGVVAASAPRIAAEGLIWASADHPPPTRPPASLLA